MGDQDPAEEALPSSSLPEELRTSGGIAFDCGKGGNGTYSLPKEIENQVGASVIERRGEIDASVEELVRAQSLSVDAIHKHYCKDLLEAANTLQSVCNVQDTSITLIEYKEKVLLELRESYQLEEIIDEAQRYFEKLVGLKKEMAALSRKSKDLTRRAAYVKAVREKEKTKRDQERKRLERLEQDLAPRYSSDLV